MFSCIKAIHVVILNASCAQGTRIYRANQSTFYLQIIPIFGVGGWERFPRDEPRSVILTKFPFPTSNLVHRRIKIDPQLLVQFNYERWKTIMNNLTLTLCCPASQMRNFGENFDFNPFVAEFYFSPNFEI